MFKSNIVSTTPEIDKLFEKINNGIIKIKNVKDYNHLFDVNKITESREDLEKFLITWDGVGDISKSYQQWMIDNGKATSTFANFIKKAGNILKSFGATIASMGMNWLIGEAIGLAVTAIDNVANSAKHAEENANAFVSSIRSQQETFSSNVSTITDLSSKYEELSKGVSNVGENLSLTSEDYSSYKDIISQVSELMPDLNVYYNEQGEKIGFVSGKLKDLNKEYNQYQKRTAIKLLNEGDENGKTLSDVIENYNSQKDTGALSDLFNGIKTLSGNGYDELYSNQEILNSLEELRNLSQDEMAKKLGRSDNLIEYVWNILTARIYRGTQQIDPNATTDLQRALQDILEYDGTDINNMTAEEFEVFKETLQTKIESYSDKIDLASSAIGDSLLEIAQSKDSYWNLEDNKQYVDSFFKNINKDMIEAAGLLDENGEISESAMRQFVNKIISVVSENKNGVSDAFKELFAIDFDDESIDVDDIINKINSCIETIGNALGFNEEGKKVLKIVLGFDKIEEKLPKNESKTIDEYFNKKNTVTQKYWDKDGNIHEENIQVYDDKRSKELNDWQKQYSVTEDELEKLKEKGYSAKTSIEELSKAINVLRGKNADGSTSFKKAWESIGKEGTDEEKKAAEEAKEKLIELAEAGKLTISEFKDSTIADTLEKAGFSAEKATKKINDMVSSADQLASMKSGISSISSILGEKKENLSNKKTKNDGIGADTLSGMPDDVKAQADEYENFVKVLGNGASTMQQCREAANNLATAYVNSYNFLSKLTPETVGYYTSVLKQMGVENASEVVTNALAKQTYALRLEKLANSNATKEEITALQEEASQYGITSTALANYVIQKRIANNNALDTSKSISNLIKLAKQCGATSNVVIALQNLLKSTSELESLYQKDLTDFSSNAATDLQHAPDVAANEKSEALGKASAKISASRKKLLKLIKDSTKIGASVKIKPTSPSNGSKGSKGSKGSSKKEKTEINWLERRLTRMQSIIDLTASKLQNLFSVKAKNNNLDKQIKQTTKLMNQYKIAADTYMKKANSVAKSGGLSKDIIKKVQSGEITKASYSKLIKKYGQSYADKINSYIDYYDKAQDAKKNAEDQKAKIRQDKIDKQTNIQEKADAKSSKYQSQRELAKLEDKNTWIKLERASTEESYEAQIKAAELQYGKKSVEVSKLTYEKKKALLDLYQEEIDNIKANTDARIQSLENGVVNNNGTRRSYGQKYYQNQISLAEARGNKVNKDWYRQQSAIENQKISEYTSERNQLIAKLSGLTEGTTEWYNLQADIQACDDSINESLIAQAENTKAMRELTEKMEQEYDDWFSNLNNEISFISSLASGDMTDSDKGTFTDAGNLAMYSQSLLFQSANAEKEYWKTQTNKLQKLIETNASVAQIQAAGFEFNSIEDANDALTSYRQNWQDAIKEEKQAEEEIINLMKERYEAEKDYLQDIVDARKESLNLEKDLYDYERNIAEKTKNVVTLQKRINSLRGDTSEEGRARLSKLQVELDSAQKDLQDTEYDRYISEQQNMLDNMMSQYEDLMTKLQKNTDAILKEGFKYVNDNIGNLTDLFDTTGAGYGYEMSTGLSNLNTSLGQGITNIVGRFDNNSVDISDIKKGINGDDSSVIGLLQSMAGSIIEEYKNYETEKNTTASTNNGGSGSGSGNGSSGSGSTKQQTQTTNGQTTVTPDAMDKIEGTNAKLKKLRDALNSMKGAGFEKYWTKKNGTPKSYINQRIAAEPNYDKIVNGKHLHPQILTEAGLKLLAKKLGVKYPASSGAKTTNLNNYVKEAGFKTGGIAQLVKSNGEDGLMMARNGEGFVSPEHVQDIKELMKVIPDMNKFISSVTETPNIPIARNNQSSNSIGEVLFNIDVNPKDFPDFVSQLQNEKRVQQVFSVAVNDLTQKGKITNNIQRY